MTRARARVPGRDRRPPARPQPVATPPASELLRLQRTAGNRAVTQMLQRQPEAPSQNPPLVIKADARTFTVDFQYDADRRWATSEIFELGRVPDGWRLDADGALLGRRWTVTMPKDPGKGFELRATILKAVDRARESARQREEILGAGPVGIIGAPAGSRERIEAANRRTLDETIDFLGLTTREVLAWGPGFYERNDHFIYIGPNADRDWAVQWAPYYRNEQLNEDFRWLMSHGISLQRAQDLLNRYEAAVLRIVIGSFALALGGADDLAEVMLKMFERERVMAELDALEAGAHATLDADAKVLGAALAAAGVAGATPSLTNAEVGEIAEAEARKLLESRGYTKVVALQNASGHGLDLVGIKEGKDGSRLIVYFEVKGSRTEAAGRLSKAQRNITSFVTSRLSGIVAGSKGYANVDAATREMAEELLNEITVLRRPVGGAVIDVLEAGTANQAIKVRRWTPHTPRRGGMRRFLRGLRAH
jgi:hypothetical protein